MKDWIRKNQKVILTTLVFVVIGPIIIHVLFKWHSPINFLTAEWQASDVLSYYGTIIAAVIAIFGIFITLQYSQESYKDDIRNRSLPFMTITLLRREAKRNIFAPGDRQPEQDDKMDEGYREYKLTDYYCILEDGKIKYQTALTSRQRKLQENCGMEWGSQGNVRSLCAADNICLPLEIENVGNGAAIRMRVGVNRKEADEECWKYIRPFSLKSGTPITLHVFSEDCSKDSPNIGRYILSLFYEDIFANKYVQNFNIEINYNEEFHAPMALIDLSGDQQLIGGK